MATSQPTVQPKLAANKFGINRATELFNGRAAMIGFASLLIIEFLTGQNPVTWMISLIK
jgi:Chlorophyll A-B binding protein